MSMRILNKISAIAAIALGALALVSPAAADTNYTFTSGSGVAVTGSNYTASGPLNLSLAFEPKPGTNLTVVKNTGLAFISGTFSNVPQGGTVPLTYNGVTYNYIANYYGGNGRSLVLQWPCMGLTAWGGAQKRNDSTTSNNTYSSVPVAVDTTGALAGKTVVALAGGEFHSLVLTSDGKVFAWGFNPNGQLGNSGTANSSVPVAVDTSGALAGKTVVAIAAGSDHSLALTSDGKVFAWGYNAGMQLGNNSTTDSSVPVAVNTSGALAGKTVVAIAAGDFHSLALTSDGQVFTWGNNNYGQLGNDSTTSNNAYSSVPVAVNTSGALSGKTVVAIAAGSDHSMALASDGKVFVWGNNTYGDLGSCYRNFVPVAVDTTGALAGKTVVAIAAGGAYNSDCGHSLALTSDGKVFAWGSNFHGQLGNNSTTDNPVPVAVTSTAALADKSVVAIAAGNAQSLALTSDGQVFGWGNNNVGQLGNNSTTNASVPVAVTTTGALASKTAVSIASGYYHSLAMFGSGPPSVIVNPVSQPATSGVTVTFSAAATDNPAPSVQWQVSTTGTAGAFSNIFGNATAATGTLTLNNVTLAQNGYAYRAIFTNNAGSCTTTAATLTVVNGRDLVAAFTSGTDVPVTANNVYVSGSLTVVLGFTPVPGTNLTVVNNTGLGFIGGKFSNVPQGGTVPLTYAGITYNYIANYYGGNGRSLVLQWPCIGLDAWGSNSSGQLGNNSTTDRSAPVAVVSNGVLAGKTMVAIAGGEAHSMALTSDGQIFAWGQNHKVYNWYTGYYGQLGNNGKTDSSVPVAVTTSGALAGKTVVAIAAGWNHNLALSSNGQVFAWGWNSAGQLGNNNGGMGACSTVPVAVVASGALVGKTVVAIAGGGSHSLALTSDGQVFAWGYNWDGELGNNALNNSAVPVAVDTSGVLAGKKVVAISAGYEHSLALTSDGQVFAWGSNDSGQLGNNSTVDSSVPVAVNTSGALADKTVVAIAAGGAFNSSHSLALTSDGQVFAWGANNYGQLGNNSTTNSSVPVAVGGALTGKAVSAIAAGKGQSCALTSDGQVFAWGHNNVGQLGNNTTTDSSVPVAVSTIGASAGHTVTAIATGCDHGLAIFGSGAPSVATNPANQSGTSGATVYFAAASTDNPSPSVQWQMSTTGSSGSFSNILGNPTATTGTLILTNIAPAQHGYAYRAAFTNNVGSCMSTIATLSVQRTFASFQGHYGLLNSDPTADPYNTGVCQLAAYAFGVNPSAPDRSQLPSVAAQNGHLQITYPQWTNTADLTYVVEVSSDLTTWYSGPSATLQFSASADPNDATRQWVVVRDLIPTSSVPRRFIRVRITRWFQSN